MKYYIFNNQLFYEGQTLCRYTLYNKNLIYTEDVILKKFIVHYFNKKPVLYFRFGNTYNKVEYTLPCDYLGFFYKIKKDF